MERCENCKHWAADGHIHNEQDKRPCMKLSGGRSDVFTVFVPVITWVKTQPDFGCTLFERKGGE